MYSVCDRSKRILQFSGQHSLARVSIHITCSDLGYGTGGFELPSDSLFSTCANKLFLLI